MAKELSSPDSSPAELRELIKWAVALLGQVIEEKLGAQIYREIESLRSRMAQLRDEDDQGIYKDLSVTLEALRKLKATERLSFARAFTLMLELINICENAYRSHRLAFHTLEKNSNSESTKLAGDAIIYVLTAHPTEARSPQNIAAFRFIQKTLIQALRIRDDRTTLNETLLHQLHIAWEVSAVRTRAPHVRDEAAHIYSILFAEGTIDSLLAASQHIVPIYIRTWVGGDKDGHPGVDETVMHESLTLSRSHLIDYVKKSLEDINHTLHLLPAHPFPHRVILP